MFKESDFFILTYMYGSRHRLPALFNNKLILPLFLTTIMTSMKHKPEQAIAVFSSLIGNHSNNITRLSFNRSVRACRFFAIESSYMLATRQEAILCKLDLKKLYEGLGSRLPTFFLNLQNVASYHSIVKKLGLASPFFVLFTQS